MSKTAANLPPDQNGQNGQNGQDGQDGLLGEFLALLDRGTPQLLRLAARIVGDTDEAEDVLQDSCIRAYDALLHGRFEVRASLSSWLYRVVANAAMDALRARKRRSGKLRPAVALAFEETPRLEAREALRQLDDLLADLPPEQRVALILKELEGLSTPEIAATLKSSVGSVEQLLVRARTHLRAGLRPPRM